MNHLQRSALTSNRLYLNGPVNHKMFSYVKEAIDTKLPEGSPKLMCHICSQGGHVEIGLNIYDLLKYYPGQKVGVAHSVVGSIAAIILQAFDWRVATRHTGLLIHQVAGTNINLGIIRDPESLQRFIRSMEYDQEVISDLLVKRTGRTLEEISNVCARGELMDADAARLVGLVDQVVENENDIRVEEKQPVQDTT